MTHRVGEHLADGSGVLSEGVAAGQTERHEFAPTHAGLPGERNRGHSSTESGPGDFGHHRAAQRLPIKRPGAGDDQVVAGERRTEAGEAEDLRGPRGPAGAEEHEAVAQATAGPGSGFPVQPTRHTGEEVDAHRSRAADEIGEVAKGPLERLGSGRGCPPVRALQGAGPGEPEQDALTASEHDEVGVGEPRGHLRESGQGMGGCGGQSGPAPGQVLGGPGTEGPQRPGAAVVGGQGVNADDDPGRAFAQGRGDELADPPTAGESRVAFVGGEQVKPGRLGGVEVCRALPPGLGEEHLGGHRARERVAHGESDAPASDGGGEHIEQAGSATAQRVGVDSVMRCADGPPGGDRGGRLGRTERRPERLWGDENTHSVRVVAPYDRGMSTAPLPLLVLGSGRDLHTERGVECPGDLPPSSDPSLVERARAAKAALGDSVFILGHHYQRDEVIEFADVTGDSFKLAKEAAARPEAPFIVFCGVHFMAESADILTADTQTVILPDLAAGCSMADMAAIDQVEDCWDELAELGLAQSTVPVTYMNSSAAIKAFTGRRGGTICTSSNAKTALSWALERAGEGGKVLFLPDQHLGRNTYVNDLRGGLDDCVVWDPHKPMGGLTIDELRSATMILWRGHCSVHGRFSVEAVQAARREIPDVKIIVHPECRHEVVELADEVGSTERIIKTIAAAPAGTAWAVGTELNLVSRLARQFPDQRIAFLEKNVCYCSTMNRIDLPHLVWALESLVDGMVVNPIRVDPDVAHHARVALDQMLALPGETHKD